MARSAETTRVTSAPVLVAPPNGPVDRLLDEVYSLYRTTSDGEVASSIPELANTDPSLFGLALTTMDGIVYTAGASTARFPIGSVSKPFVYALALAERGFEDVVGRVGLEPTGNAFSAITLEPGTGKPLNPMANAGALLTTSLIGDRDGMSRFERIRAGLSVFAGRSLDVDENVYQSEQATGERTRAIAYLMRTSGALLDDVDEVCTAYFRQWALLVTCADLAVMAGTLARGGVNPVTGERLLSEVDAGRTLAVMSTCGMYENAGQWMLRVGLPAKGGASGGICAVLPGQLGIGTFSPLLDMAGNSVRGVLACQELSHRVGLHVLHAPRMPAHPVHSTYRADVVSSKRVRPLRERRLLHRLGSTIVVHELQGDLGFAAAERVVRTIRNNLTGMRWLVLDLRRVATIDASAVVLLRLLVCELGERQVTILFADPHRIPAVAELEVGDGSTRRVRDCETALEWAEEALLARENVQVLQPTTRVPFASQELLAELGEDEVDVLRTVTETRVYGRGDMIFDEGAPGDGMYFLTRGLVNVEVTAVGGGRRFRMSTVPAGSAFGEVALLDSGPRASRIVVAEAAECELLSVEAFEKLRRDHPEISDKIFCAIARNLASRLRQMTREMQRLED